MRLPAAPQDWLRTRHLVHFINDTIDALDLQAFYARFEGGSRNQLFHPAMMVKALIDTLLARARATNEAPTRTAGS